MAHVLFQMMFYAVSPDILQISAIDWSEFFATLCVVLVRDTPVCRNCFVSLKNQASAIFVANLLNVHQRDDFVEHIETLILKFFPKRHI